MKHSFEKLKELQKPNGGYERFHSMSKTSPITTEHALRKCMYSGMTKEDVFLKLLINYVTSLLHEKEPFPDRVEKVIDWTVFTRLMYSAWLKIFEVDDHKAREVIIQWQQVVEHASNSGLFDMNQYNFEYNQVFGKPKKSERYINPANFYVVNLLHNELSIKANEAFFNYIMDNGIYYVYNCNLWKLPSSFDSNTTINYLMAIKMASRYCNCKDKLLFVKEWIMKHRSDDSFWYTKNIKQDGYIFDGNWRRKEEKANQVRHFFNDIMSSI